MRRRIATAMLTLLGMFGVAGCMSVPGSGPVETGLTDLSQAEQYVQFNPLGPVSGSTQEDVVRGFLLAASSSTDDYQVAREFLTPEFSAEWDPDLGVVVDDGSRPYESVGESAGVLQVSAIANVDAEGALLPTTSGSSRELRFEFERVGDEWRIASAPPGIVLDSTTFTAIWSPHQLYFVGPEGALVPDTRWFVSSAALPTAIVERLLLGPSDRVAPAVTTAFPEGTEMLTDSVVVVDGRARVDLSGAVLSLGPDALIEMQRQLLGSLSTVTGVSGIDIYSGSTPVRLPESDGEYKSPQAEASSPAVIVDGVLGTLAAGDFQEMAGLSEAMSGLQPDAVTLSGDGSAAAVRSRGEVQLIDGGETVLLDAGQDILEPGFDLYGYVWVYHNSTGSFTVSNSSGSHERLDAPWLSGKAPVAVSLSPDGSRVAALVASSSNGSEVLVGVVERDASGIPVAVSPTADVQMVVRGAPVDLDWIDSVRFVTLTRSGSAGVVTVGGPGLLANEQGSVPGGVKIASGGSRSQLRVLADDQRLYASQGSNWQLVISEVQVLAKRG